MEKGGAKADPSMTSIKLVWGGTGGGSAITRFERENIELGEELGEV